MGCTLMSMPYTVYAILIFFFLGAAMGLQNFDARVREGHINDEWSEIEQQEAKYQAMFPPSDKTKHTELYLYSGVVESHLGKRAALVVSTLINYGRLTIRELSQRSNLSAVIVKKTLISLIQLKCVSVWEDKSYRGSTTYYYFREEGVLMMLYSGEIIAHIEESYHNDNMTQIVQNFLSLGKLNISEYISSFHSADAEATSKLEDQFATLVRDNYLTVVENSHFCPHTDLWTETFNKALAKVPKSATTSELKRTAEAKSIAKLDYLNTLNHRPDNLYIKDKSTMKDKINPQLPLAFNLQRFLKSKRTKQLSQLCSHRVGKLTSIIYKQALTITEKESPEVSDPLLQIGLTNEEILNKREYEPKTGVIFSARDLTKRVTRLVDLSGSVLSGPVKRKAAVNGNGNGSKRTKLDTTSYATSGIGYDNEDDEDDMNDFDDAVEVKVENSLGVIDQHLKILTKSEIPFLKKINGGAYYVPFPDLVTQLKRCVLESLITATFGAPSTRVLRCVRDNRLVSEKLINSVALLREKDARSLTSVLVKHNFLQIQEVPKSADRAASKSVFLYRVSDKHCNDTMKTNICWNMGRIIDGVLMLKLENSGLISKINRDDVRGKELEYLLPSELAQLKQMNDNELSLTVKLHRLASIWEVFKFY